MKTRAYKDQLGRETVTAYGVARERDRFHRGEPTGQIYYSIHSAGRRKSMSHVYRSDCAPHFKYINVSDENAGGPGESLEHELFKRAVGAMAGTTLKLGKLGSHRIVVVESEVEKDIKTEGYPLRGDVFLRFENESGLALKWGGEVYVEIRHTHSVDKDKLDLVSSLRLPMVEVPIPPSLIYPYDAENTTDEREDAYVARIKRVLESENGFLWCEVLSNPSTVEYMELEVADLRKKLRASERSRTTAEERVTELSVAVGTLKEEARALARHASVANEAAIDNAGKADVASKEVGQLKRRLAAQDDELNELRPRLNNWLVDGRLVVAGMFVVALVVWTVLFFLR